MRLIQSLGGAVLIAALALAASPVAAAESSGVYVEVVTSAVGSFDEVVAALDKALEGAGLKVLASYDSGVEKRCSKRAHNTVAMDEQYAALMMKHGANAAFALPIRVGVYESASGISITVLNLKSVNRTVLGDGVADAAGADAVERVTRAIQAAVQGTASSAQLGQLRDKGRVGGMGGGDFADKVEAYHKGGKYDETLAKVREGIAAEKSGWRLVYEAKLTDTVTLFGLTNPATEARAFGIAGESRESSANSCPGLDHAAAFPIEVVALDVAGSAELRTLDEMYRMKLYFEDAGNWAFMKNMAMPGQIEDEVKAASTSKLK